MYFQLGNGDDFDVKKPKIIESLKGEKIIRANGGLFHSTAVNEKGECFSWGLSSNVGNQLGHKGVRGIPKPKKIDFLQKIKIINSFCGLHHTLKFFILFYFIYFIYFIILSYFFF